MGCLPVDTGYSSATQRRQICVAIFARALPQAGRRSDKPNFQVSFRCGSDRFMSNLQFDSCFFTASLGPKKQLIARLEGAMKIRTQMINTPGRLQRKC